MAILPLCLFFLHLHDRGSVGFPAEIHSVTTERPTLFEPVVIADASTRANLLEPFWRAVCEYWGLAGGLEGEDAKSFIKKLFRVCLSLCHAPQYEEEHRESLGQDWAHVPIPRDRELFEELASTGDLIAILLNPLDESRTAIRSVIGDYAPKLAGLTSITGGAVRQSDLVVTISHFGAARGGWRSRQFGDDEIPPENLGELTGDLYINENVFFRNIPKEVWRYELGGYPVLKKWLGYRDAGRRNSQPLSLAEKDHFRSMVQRIASLVLT